MSPFWILLELSVMEVVSGDDWRSVYGVQSSAVKISPSTNLHPASYRRPAALPVAQPTGRVVFEWGGGDKAGGLPHPSLSPFPPLPLSIPPRFSDKPVGGKVRSSEGEVPWLPPYKYHPADRHVDTSVYWLQVIRLAITVSTWPSVYSTTDR